MYDVSPKEFIQLICNADIVVTDSFHATVFSIIFQTKFIVFPRNENDKNNTRISTLLSVFGLNDHIISDNINDNYQLLKIADKEVKDKSDIMEKLKKEAIEFFRRNLEGVKYKI